MEFLKVNHDFLLKIKEKNIARYEAMPKLQKRKYRAKNKISSFNASCQSCKAKLKVDDPIIIYRDNDVVHDFKPCIEMINKYRISKPLKDYLLTLV